MAAGVLAAPGTEYGPCDSECRHTDCALTRAMADDLCTICGEPIGYDIRFYGERVTNGAINAVNGYRYQHAACIE